MRVLDVNPGSRYFSIPNPDLGSKKQQSINSLKYEFPPVQLNKLNQKVVIIQKLENY
jgi:hypothetical protein